MDFENTVDYLRTLEIEELTRLWIISNDMDEGFNQELIDLVSIEHEFLYGESNIKLLDAAQLNCLNKEIEKIIIYKLVDEYEQKK